MSKRKIPIHVFNYSLALLPVCIYTVYTLKYGESDEELEKIIRENHTSSLKASQESKQALNQFFQGIRDPSKMNKEQEHQLSNLLRAGKEESFKRHHTVDSSLYGTQEGFEQAEKLQLQAKEDAEQQKLRKKQRKKKKNKRNKANTNTNTSTITPQSSNSKNSTGANEKQDEDSHTDRHPPFSFSVPTISNEKASVIVMIVAATAAGFLMGDKRSR